MCKKKNKIAKTEQNSEQLPDLDSDPNNKIYYIFLGCYSGTIKQFNENFEMVFEYKNMFEGMIVDLDYKDDFLYVADTDGFVKTFSISKQVMTYDWGNISEFGINFLAVTND